MYKSYPTTEVNKRYRLKIQEMIVPQTSDGLILNQELFTIERRLQADAVHTQFPLGGGGGSTITGPVEFPVNATFTPQNCKTTADLVFQMNDFFRKFLSQLICSGAAWNDAADQVHIVDEYKAVDDTDWYEALTGNDHEVFSTLSAIYYSNGKIGFQFSTAGQIQFVIRLTDEAQRIFGFKEKYIGVDEAGTFFEYSELASYTTEVDEDNPFDDLVATEEFDQENTTHTTRVLQTPNSLFNHHSYRSEIAVVTSLPLRNYVHCDHKAASYRQQLVSYRTPQPELHVEYDKTYFKKLKIERTNRYLFEHSNETHNEFILTGTELQNFHLRLISRSYQWNTNEERYDIIEKDYTMPEDSLWTITLCVQVVP